MVDQDPMPSNPVYTGLHSYNYGDHRVAVLSTKARLASSNSVKMNVIVANTFADVSENTYTDLIKLNLHKSVL